MQRPLMILVAALVLAACGLADSAAAIERRVCRFGPAYPWHGGYYNVSWGMPVALVVPPISENQVHWGWGVGNTRITPICSQFKRDWPGPGYYDRSAFYPTPRWPSDTDQFGIYYVRGPW